MLNDKMYNVLKYIALIFLDAVGICYQSLADVWSLPYGDEVLKTCAILSTFIGALIGVSSYKYHKPTAQELTYADRDEDVGSEV